MDKFEEKISFLMQEKIEKIIANNKSISVESAREEVREMSFGEYSKLIEATADMRKPESADNQAEIDLAKSSPNQTVFSPGDPVAVTDLDGNTKVGILRARRGKEADIDIDGKKVTVASDMLNNPNSMAEDEEIARLKELSGIKEMSSAGATAAGSIATAPSVIGNTARRPSETLGSKQREKKDNKRKRDKNGKKKRNHVKQL